MAADLRQIRDRLKATGASVKAFQSMQVIDQSLTGLELGIHLLLGVVFFEATLSELTGIALLALVGMPRVSLPRSRT